MKYNSLNYTWYSYFLDLLLVIYAIGAVIKGFCK